MYVNVPVSVSICFLCFCFCFVLLAHLFLSLLVVVILNFVLFGYLSFFLMMVKETVWIWVDGNDLGRVEGGKTHKTNVLHEYNLF